MKKRKPNPYRDQYRVWYPFHSPDDPCPPIAKQYVVPPNQFLGFQPPNLPQFSKHEALIKGTLWPIFYSPYPPKKWRDKDGT
ncbi:spore coat associated protein CotJA [Shimazuella sp. AN120528]|uniref:spore coat associated protein CotJA n=1 Tax=Shimazuella soli TaxID=1892854 RepID=UPI001F0E6912|nr:spore coat associated protein CotJA [Shimazuella soli]MCH5584820.1 spore coat associated protein CotJA [Shimazuella soli]